MAIKNHIDIDVKHKLIRSYEVTPASVHDSNVFEELLDGNNSSKDVWADSAYGSAEKRETLKEDGYRSHIQRKGCRYLKLTQPQKLIISVRKLAAELSTSWESRRCGQAT